MAEEINEFEKLQFVRDVLMQEQHFYWARFSAFAAMNAGLFVLTTSTVLETPTAAGSDAQQLLIGFAFALSIIWVFIQWISFYYVSRWKPTFHKLREKYGISLPRHWLFNSLGLSATGLGVFVTIVVAALWGVMFF